MSLVPIGILSSSSPFFLTTNLIVIANILAYNKVNKEIIDAKH
jgi:hypothetical protein